MKIHWHWRDNNPEHSHVTLWINGKNVGSLCMSPSEAVLLRAVLDTGVSFGQDPSVKFSCTGEAPTL